MHGSAPMGRAGTLGGRLGLDELDGLGFGDHVCGALDAPGSAAATARAPLAAGDLRTVGRHR